MFQPFHSKDPVCYLDRPKFLISFASPYETTRNTSVLDYLQYMTLSNPCKDELINDQN